jgi:hypothetical protein
MCIISGQFDMMQRKENILFMGYAGDKQVSALVRGGMELGSAGMKECVNLHLQKEKIL